MTGPVRPSDPLRTASPPPAPRPRRWPARHSAVALALTATLAFATTACGGSESDATPTATVDRAPTSAPETATTITGDATTTTEALTPEEEVEQAYLKAADVFYDALGSTSDPKERLEATRADEALDRVQGLVGDLREKGLVVEYGDDGPPVPAIREIELRGEDGALVTFCIVDDGQQVDVGSGKIVDDRVQSRLNEATMKQVDGAWKVTSQRGIRLWEDADGCDR